MTEPRRRAAPIAVPEDSLLEALLEFAREAESAFQARKAERKMRLRPIQGDRSRRPAA